MYRLLETERLIIRPINLQDSDFIIRLLNSEGWKKFIGDRNVRDKADAELYILNIQNNKKFFYNVFELKETKQAVGIITFLNREDYDHPDIGFALLPEFERQGYTFEAARRYLDEIIKTRTARKVVGIVLPENVSSIKMLEKLGLTFKNKINQDGEELSLYEMLVQ